MQAIVEYILCYVSYSRVQKLFECSTAGHAHPSPAEELLFIL